MKSLIIAILTILSLLSFGCSNKPVTNEDNVAQELNVMAAISLKDSLTEIAIDYQRKHPNVKIVYNFAASGTLQQQIEQGAPADVFISAAKQQMDALSQENLIDNNSRKNLLNNQLVLIVPSTDNHTITTIKDLLNSHYNKIAIGEPRIVPAGTYAQKALINQNIWDKLQERLVLAKDVRAVLTYVASSNVEAGFVYKTDALTDSNVKVAFVVPAEYCGSIDYPIAITNSSKQKDIAINFIDFLSNPDSNTIFEKYGFSLIKQ